MSLPEVGGWDEYEPKDIGNHFGSLFESVLAERDAAWREQVENLEVELDLAAARIEELSGVVGKEAA